MVGNSLHNDNTLFDVRDRYSDYIGTQLASVIAASSNYTGIVGVAPKVKIMPLKVVSDREGTISGVIKAIDYAEKHGAKIANIGWYFYAYSQALHDAIEHSSLLFVTAAGQDSQNTDIYRAYPGSFNSPNILNVAAVDRAGSLIRESAFGKNSVDIGAPGDYIVQSLLIMFWAMALRFKRTITKSFIMASALNKYL